MQPTIERRKTARHRVFKGARLVSDGQTFKCVVRNVSDRGAGIEIEHGAAVPNTVTLVFDQDRTVRHGQLRWRDAQRMGIAFD